MINVLLMRPLRFISLSLSLLQHRQAASEAPAMPSQASEKQPFSPTILGGERDSQKKNISSCPRHAVRDCQKIKIKHAITLFRKSKQKIKNKSPANLQKKKKKKGVCEIHPVSIPRYYDNLPIKRGPFFFFTPT